jgi:hypothetical protein
VIGKALLLQVRVLVLGLAFAGIAYLWLAVLSDTASTVLVVLHSLTLLRFQNRMKAKGQPEKWHERNAERWKQHSFWSSDPETGLAVGCPLEPKAATLSTSTSCNKGCCSNGVPEERGLQMVRYTYHKASELEGRPWFSTDGHHYIWEGIVLCLDRKR